MWINFNYSFIIVTTKFLYTNVELNLPHHLNYVAALPCKCTQRIVQFHVCVQKLLVTTLKKSLNRSTFDKVMLETKRVLVLVLGPQVLILVLEPQVLVLVLVLGPQILILVLEPQFLVLVLVLGPQVLVLVL